MRGFLGPSSPDRRYTLHNLPFNYRRHLLVLLGLRLHPTVGGLLCSREHRAVRQDWSPPRGSGLHQPQNEYGHPPHLRSRYRGGNRGQRGRPEHIQETDTISPTFDTVVVTLSKTVLPLTGGSTALTSMAANTGFIFIGTDQNWDRSDEFCHSFTTEQLCRDPVWRLLPSSERHSHHVQQIRLRYSNLRRPHRQRVPKRYHLVWPRRCRSGGWRRSLLHAGGLAGTSALHITLTESLNLAGAAISLNSDPYFAPGPSFWPTKFNMALFPQVRYTRVALDFSGSLQFRVYPALQSDPACTNPVPIQRII